MHHYPTKKLSRHIASVLMLVASVVMSTTTLASDVNAKGMRSQHTSIQSQQPFTTSIQRFVVSPQGTVTPATQANYGDTIEYRIIYRNVGTQDIESFYATVTIPESVTLLQNGFKPSITYGTLDGETFYPMPIRIKKEGQSVIADYSRYKAVQWRLAELPRKQSVTLIFRAKQQ